MKKEIEFLKIDDLKPYSKNPKIHSNKQIEQIANSIKKFGFLNPIIVDKNDVIIAGHGRYQAAKMLGLTEIPCLRAENLSDKEVRAYRLIDNKLAENAIWDTELLTVELADLPDFDMADFGFEEEAGIPDINDLIETKNTQEEGKDKKEVFKCPNCGFEWEK